MKTKSLLLVSFFIVLYIAPLIFAPSYISPTIPTEQNMSKEFQISIGESWLDGWDYRKQVSITGVAGAGTNYQIPVTITYNSNMQSDFDDIRFTEDDGITLLYHWRESYTASTTSLFWVNVTDDLDSNQVIYFYYGNATALDASDGANTFVVYEDWASESIRADVWDIITMDGSPTYSSSGATHGTISTFGPSNSAQRITSDYDACAPLAVRFLSRLKESTTGNTVRQGSGYDGAFGFALVQSVATGETFYVYDDDGNADSQAMTLDYFDTWITFEIQRGFITGPGVNNTKLYADDVLIEQASFDPDIISSNPATSIMIGGTASELKSDWVLVRKFITIEPTVSSIGDAEDNREWDEIGDATLYFNMSLDYWAFNMFMVFFGLILVIVSGCYLAYSIKNNMSQDKFFYFLIAFFMGWGLFLGGMLI